MYLDTDIVLALVKKDDWLKRYVKIEKIRNPKTSTLAILEAEIILNREYGREYIFSIFDRIKSLKIKILPLTEMVIQKSLEMLKKYHRLNIFDSLHIAFCIVENEKVLSTDTIFNEIEELQKIDPRGL